ncbi:MAG TPA: aminoglycoside phosphotransferase family protein [Symbiobacteriaceae bacterium]|nr:aminoglycoside phosphotransferase family protein [Symbiobacteriaceae bacterium]
MIPENWPSTLVAHLVGTWGHPVGVNRLSGIGGPGSFHVTFPGVEVVVKTGREGLFYKRAAPLLRARGVTVPAVWRADEGWVVMEYIPHPLPRSRWVGDAAVVGALARLHGSTLGEQCPLPDPYRPGWSADMTGAALSCLDSTGAAQARPLLLRLQEQCQPLFEPVCWISGDPNPTNWGVREDGSVVLFDWERFGLGAPALDLAITVPGLVSPNGGPERAVADRYCEQWSALYGDSLAPPANLVPDMRRAKVWTAVELLDAWTRGALPEGTRGTVDFVVAHFVEMCTAAAGGVTDP